MEICRRLGHGSPSCSCLVMHTMHTMHTSSRPPNIFKAYQAMQCNSVFDQILTNQSGDVSDHCSSVDRFTVSNNSSLLNFQLFTLGGFNVGFWVFVVEFNLLEICWWLLLGLPHPLDDKARSPSDEDVLLLGRGVHDRRHQQLPERLPRLDQQVVGPATEPAVR